MVFMSEKRKQPYFNLALTMAFWSLAAMLLMPFGKAMASTPPMLDQADPAVCQGFTLPPSSPELDQILAAQQAISEAVFPAGGANYLYCNEGTWLLDQELNETKEIHSDQDSPISGVTYGGDDFLIYPFVVLDVDMTILDIDQDTLKWVQDNHVTISEVGGIIETGLGRIGFYGTSMSFDSDNIRVRMVIPYSTSNAFDILYSIYFLEGIANRSYGPGSWGDCMREAEAIFWGDVAKCDNNLKTCAKVASNAAAGVMLVCVAGVIQSTHHIILTPLAGAGCVLLGEALKFTILSSCNATHDGCITNAHIDWNVRKTICDLNPPIAGIIG